MLEFLVGDARTGYGLQRDLPGLLETDGGLFGVLLAVVGLRGGGGGKRRECGASDDYRLLELHENLL